MLDLTQVATQMDGVVNRLREDKTEHRRRLDKACTLMEGSSADFERLKQKIAASGKKTAWLVAGLVEPTGLRIPTPTTPPDHTIIATDGSNIDVDRHQSARYYLINIGLVRLDYGHDARAELTSLPKLCADESEMFLSDGLHEQAIDGPLLGIKRAVMEFDHLAEMSNGIPQTRSALALVDGTLIMWGLASEKYPDFVSHALLENGYLKAMDKMCHLAQHGRLTLASYVSFPRAAIVASTLRLAICPKDIADCNKHCQSIPGAKRPCEPLTGIQDSDIFGAMLKEGERSAIFCSQSKITERYGPHRIYFFYLKLADEVARIEIPEWVAFDKERLDLTHALIFDQCQRGGGYPVALSEAHEQAVVTGADRANFQQMLDNWLISEHLPQTTSAKSQSKRTRWV